ncbi:putative disease resistance RPP13-like protein 1 [Telopea speciosissima]|uniref:putative disease resistance RPP13-like protein 1 n=1 Tax=Telopea speciosissima TaxID=54955 RepID=UPI001CC49725|nr:putative disease resistance RPP13-like protein 1 [Telopea speciosissima]
MERSRDDIIVSRLVAILVEKLSSQALRDFGLVWCVASELHTLSDVLENIQGLLNFAKQAQTKNHLVKHCLRNLRDVAYRAEDILDEFISEARKEKDERYVVGKFKEVRFFHFNLNINGILRKEEIVPLINDELIKKLVEIEKKLEVQYCRWSKICRTHGVNDEIIDTRPKSGSIVDESFILGRKEDVNEIKKKLLSHPHENQKHVSSVIAIVGLGGLGKTTLAQLVYNDSDVEKHFERRAWVCVSTNFNAVRLISAILESLTWRNPNLSNLEPLQCELRDEIRGKRLLIVLDDVWTEKDNDWEALRVAFMAAGEGSRIIVTTQSRKVSLMMHPMYTHDLQVLSDEECWLIMERRISIDCGFVSPSLEAVGRNIVRKCKGLPLAASMVAGLLRSSSDLNQWQLVLNSCIWDLEDSNLPAALSLSYYFLPTHLKQCFVYCSVFPKDYKFDKQHLIQLWMAERFVRSNTRMKDKGGQYFDDLLHRSFFQRDNENKDRFVMHDLVHCLAQTVSGEVYGRFECEKSCCSSKETRYLSMCCVKYMFKDKTDHDHKRLHTLINLNRCYCLGRYNFPESFGGLRYLRVLHLYGIWMLPNDIGNLKYLHYINLSYARIQQLPESLCDLYNLQSLILRHSGIRELPSGMKYLCSLQHLDISWCRYLSSMPQGIGRLSSLKTLSKFPVSKDDGCGIRELKELWQLEGALSICSLQNVIDPLDARNADLMNKPKIDELELMWDGSGDRDVKVLAGLQPHIELKSLHIHNFYGLTFPRWLMIDLPSYNKLVSLTFSSCWKCQVLPPVGELPLLEFRCIKHMLELEEWSSSSRGEETEFPNLRRLTIDNCHKLRMLPQPLLSSPRLCEMSINDCPKLRLLPHEGLSKLTSLKDLYLGYEMEGLVQYLDETETLPPNMNRLSIYDCKSLLKGLRNLSSLKHLEFGPCCKINYSPKDLPTNVIVTRDW